MHILGLALVLAFGVGQQDKPVSNHTIANAINHASVLGPPCTPESFQCPLITYDSHIDQPEPQVVTAVQETRTIKPDSLGGSYLLGFSKNCESWAGGTMTWAPKEIACHWETWTCTDKSRVLLSSEDNQHHWCVRFP